MTGDPEELPELIRAHKPRLVLLDLVLPDTDGIKLMESLRELEDLPVIFISAYDRDETIVRALDAGAADYIAKPFSPSELTARVRAARRRRAEPEPFRLGDLTIHYEDGRVTVAGRLVTLTMTEFEVLRVLSANVGRAVTYDFAAAPGVGPAGARLHGPEAGARDRQGSPQQAGRRRGQAGLGMQRARRRLPHAQTRRAVTAAADTPPPAEPGGRQALGQPQARPVWRRPVGRAAGLGEASA